MATKFQAAVIGGSGYGGGELIRRLLMHEGVELTRVASIDYVGEPLARAHPHLEGLTSLCFEDLQPKDAAADMDVVFLGLPHKISALKVPELMESGAKVIDLSGDFRIQDVAAYEKYYDTRHPCPEHIKRFVYGLPEFNREQIRQAQYVASPGCFATTIELALLPLATRGWLQGSVEVVAMTGSSGSGVRATQGTHHPVRAVNIKTYKPLVHQHTPEITETLSRAGAKACALQFVPISAPLSRGIFATAFTHVSKDLDVNEIRRAHASSYEQEPFVRVPQNRMPELAAVSGSHYVETACVVGEILEERRLVTCISTLDNLIKGGAGQAIQSMNLMLGFDETHTLRDSGSWP